MKTSTTKFVETCLLKNCFSSNNKSLAKMYGCPEVKIGFPSKKITEEKQFVDFMAYDKTEELVRCYEIKTSMSDLKSNCTFSFVGHLNYLVITRDMWFAANCNSKYFTDIVGRTDIGIILCYTNPGDDMGTLSTAKIPTKVNVPNDVTNILKESLIRSLFYKYTNALVI